MVGIDLVSGQDVEWAVIGAAQEDTASGIVSENVNKGYCYKTRVKCGYVSHISRLYLLVQLNILDKGYHLHDI